MRFHLLEKLTEISQEITFTNILQRKKQIKSNVNGIRFI